MRRSLGHKEQIYAWAEAGLLDKHQLDALAAQDPLAPDGAQWQKGIERVATAAGLVLLGAGVLFFFAWNWADMHRLAKFALALTGLSSFAVLSAWATPASVLYRSAMFGCCITTGALLALIGQTYQTGADIWQLFAVWAVLTLPWALLARSNACWSLFWAVGNFALCSFFAQSRWQGLYAGLQAYQAVLVLAGANTALLLVFERFDTLLLAYPRRSIQRLACLGVLSALGCGAAAAWWETDLAALLLAFLVVSAAMLFYFHQRCRDLPVLALIVFWMIVVATSGLVNLSIDADETFLLLNGIGLFVLVSSGLAALWLTRLSRESIE